MRDKAMKSTSRSSPATAEKKKTSVASLKNKAARLTRKLREARTELRAKNAQLTDVAEQQTATGNILRVINNSPTDAQPVFDAIIRSARQLSKARFGVLHRFDG